VKVQVEALLAAISEDTPVNLSPCDVSEEIKFSKSGKACGFDGILHDGIFQEDLLRI
jgi:hypothetical protein